jgi:enoyl-[acyl-carrier-protein] reductase (NADH)
MSLEDAARYRVVGAMAAVLASPLASYVTGARIVVDGGLELSGPGIFNAAVDAAVGRS